MKNNLKTISNKRKTLNVKHPKKIKKVATFCNENKINFHRYIIN